MILWKAYEFVVCLEIVALGNEKGVTRLCPFAASRKCSAMGFGGHLISIPLASIMPSMYSSRK